MKKIRSATVLWALAAIMFTTTGGCFKDTGSMRYKLYEPVFESADKVFAAVKNGAPQPIENAGKMCILGNTVYLVELEKGIHVIDNSNPSAPVNKAFITIPGNEDISVKGNMLYADCYSNLIAVDISDMNNIKFKSVIANIFPDRKVVNGIFLFDPTKIPVGWNIRDTTVTITPENGRGMWTGTGFLTPVFLTNPVMLFSSLSYSAAAAPGSTIGSVGSMTKMAIVNDRLYTVSQDLLNAISISDPANPVYLVNNNLHLGIGAAETIYPFNDKLFIGSTTGMYIFSIANPDKPVKLSTFTHAKVCDPVITDGINAFITLHSGTSCGGTENEMQVVNVQDLLHPSFVVKYPLSSPRGLSKDGNTLFVCDVIDGLKIYDATNAGALILKQTISVPNAYDLICLNKIIYLSAKDGLYQFDYSDLSNIKKLSVLSLH